MVTGKPSIAVSVFLYRLSYTGIFIQRRSAFGLALRSDHLTEDEQRLFRAFPVEHVFDPEQPDPFSAKRMRFLGVIRRVRVRADFQAAEIYRTASSIPGTTGYLRQPSPSELTHIGYPLVPFRVSNRLLSGSFRPRSWSYFRDES